MSLFRAGPRRQDLRKVRIGMMVMSLLGIVPLIVRVFEFRGAARELGHQRLRLGRLVLLGLHTTHILTDLVDTLVLAALMFTRHGQNLRRFGDVQDNAMYWNFVVAAWLPIYGCIYWVSRL